MCKTCVGFGWERNWDAMDLKPMKRLLYIVIEVSRTVVDWLELWDVHNLSWMWASKQMWCYGFKAYEKATVYLVWQLLCSVWIEWIARPYVCSVGMGLDYGLLWVNHRWYNHHTSLLLVHGTNRTELKKWINEWLELGCIVPSASPYGHPVLFAEKKVKEVFAFVLTIVL